MHYLDPDVDDHTLISELRKIQGLPDTILQYPDMLQIILQTIRTDCRLIRSYRHQILTKKLCSQLICITASEDTVASESKCEKWSAETTNTFTSLKINGGHFALYENIEKIAILLRSVLDDDSYTRV
jgi:surfactin synthase thioesterase subunit